MKGTHLTNPVSRSTTLQRRRISGALANMIYGEDLQPLPERVAKGARLLDRRRPDWFAVLDSARLDMQTYDIVSALYGDYLVGVSQLDLPADGPVDHGLTLPANHATERMWKHLTRHWQAAIRSRQQEAGSDDS